MNSSSTWHRALFRNPPSSSPRSRGIRRWSLATLFAMLISPAKIHASLSALLSSTPVSGPHTALLITPQGQLISAASIPADEDEESGEGEEGDDVARTGVITEEPYLDPPARLRLLLGLASQWNQGESPKMECEVMIGFSTLSNVQTDTCI